MRGIVIIIMFIAGSLAAVEVVDLWQKWQKFELSRRAAVEIVLDEADIHDIGCWTNEWPNVYSTYPVYVPPEVQAKGEDAVEAFGKGYCESMFGSQE